MVKEFGFPNAHYLRDWFHLFDTGLVDIFGEKGNTLLRGDLIKMIKADSEEHFQKALSNARIILRQEPDHKYRVRASSDSNERRK